VRSNVATLTIYPVPPRAEYVDLYVKYILEDSIATQFSAFALGFHTVCGGPVLQVCAVCACMLWISHVWCPPLIRVMSSCSCSAVKSWSS
jgi:hypothetical protein